MDWLEKAYADYEKACDEAEDNGSVCTLGADDFIRAAHAAEVERVTAELRDKLDHRNGRILDLEAEWAELQARVERLEGLLRRVQRETVIMSGGLIGAIDDAIGVRFVADDDRAADAAEENDDGPRDKRDS